MQSKTTELIVLKSLLDYQLGQVQGNHLNPTPKKSEAFNAIYFLGGVVYHGSKIDFEFRAKPGVTIVTATSSCSCTTPKIENSVIKATVNVPKQTKGTARFINQAVNVFVSYKDKDGNSKSETLNVLYLLDRHGKQ